MENNIQVKKSNKALIIILIIIVLGLAGYLIYDKVFATENKEDSKCEVCEKNNVDNTNTGNVIKPGLYRITNRNDTFTMLILKSDGTFDYIVNGCDASPIIYGTYSVSDNKLILNVTGGDKHGWANIEKAQQTFNIINNQKIQATNMIGCTYKDDVYEIK